MGVSRPSNVPPERCPLAEVNDPISWREPVWLSVYEVPVWQVAHSRRAKIIWPASPSELRSPLVSRYGLSPKLVNELT